MNVWRHNDIKREKLDFYNKIWRRRYHILKEYCPPPWWTCDLIITNDTHYNYERYFPISQYVHELRTLLIRVLPDSSWIPRLLKENSFRSLADFWQHLPQRLSGKVTWQAQELLQVACALASPVKNGCHASRYADQVTFLRKWLDEEERRRFISVIDYGCSTGQPTFEIATIIEECLQHGRVVGVTREPLEAWMATQRRLPHFEGTGNKGKGQIRKYAFPSWPRKINLYFVASDIKNFNLLGAVDLIICNGLIGGDHLSTAKGFLQLWKKFKCQLIPKGILMVGNRFHDGFKKREQRFFDLRPDGMQLIYQNHATSVFRYEENK